MFLFLNRVCKALLCACWLFAAWLAWQQRERLLPLWDLVQIWVEQDRGSAADRVHLDGTITSISGETTFYFRDPDGKSWHCGLVGLTGVTNTSRPMTLAEHRFVSGTRSNLVAWLGGQSVRVDATVASPLYSALGVAWVHGTNVNLKLVEQGRVSVDRPAIRMLPVMEQYGLVAAERRARKSQVGRWGLDSQVVQSAERR